MRFWSGLDWRLRFGLKAAVVVLFVLFLKVDDWGRDFRANTAEISARASDPTLKPFVSTRPTPDLVEGLRWAARRLGGWEYVGDQEDGSSTRLMFVRRSRILRLPQEITLRIEDRGQERVITGESRSRLGIADLGQNPRNLRRLLEELRHVLEGSGPGHVT